MLDAIFHDADSGFRELVRPVVLAEITAHGSQDVHVLRIDRWFGPNWFGFSHKILGAAGVTSKDPRVVPPFVPARVLSQTSFTRDAANAYVVVQAAPVHVIQESDENSRRRLSKLYANAAFFWWSSSLPESRGSLMAYLPTPEGHTGWYVGLENADAWKFGVTVRTSHDQLKKLARLA